VNKHIPPALTKSGLMILCLVCLSSCAPIGKRGSQNNTMTLAELASVIAESSFNRKVIEGYVGPLILIDENKFGYIYKGGNIKTKDGSLVRVEGASGRKSSGLEGISSLHLKIDVENCYTSTKVISEFNLSATERVSIPGSPHDTERRFFFSKKMSALGEMNLGFNQAECLDSISFLK
jgi:hypothetical protein